MWFKGGHMKKYLLLVFAVCLVATLALAADTTYTTKFYVQQGGDRAVVADGGSLDVESGGEIDVESGASLKLAGTAVTSTATELNKLAGISGDVITTTNTKTMTNKTLTSPVINTPSVVQSVAFHNYGASSADWILSATEQKAVLLWVTNAGATSDIIAPEEARMFFVYNNSGQSVTIKKSGGTGITVADARVAGVIYASGDYVRLTPDGAF
ncbi:MAG: hypothetical protein BWY95_02366 [Bacteroidetes bacterium ADurb.BinA104]|nr:MAG: hypothetical protein BWY95_02366 [Bacteroidetes bacterium ADurb.BinA104]